MVLLSNASLFSFCLMLNMLDLLVLSVKQGDIWYFSGFLDGLIGSFSIKKILEFRIFGAVLCPSKGQLLSSVFKGL